MVNIFDDSIVEDGQFLGSNRKYVDYLDEMQTS